jgi:transposase
VYIRRIKSRNSICYQIGRKRQRQFQLIEHVGCGQGAEEIEALKLKAKQRLWQLKFANQLSLFPQQGQPKAKLIKWRVTGFHQAFGSVYDRIGFAGTLFRDLVVARMVYPKSKSATVRYLKQTLGIKVSKDRIYRLLDTLDKRELTQIAYDFVVSQHKGRNLSLIFYDVTTLYFESDKEDQFRQKGYSKDHRHDMPQILVGLCVDQNGYPFDLEYFEGKTFEGHTLAKMINSLKSKYTFQCLTIVADAGMLSKDNLEYLEGKKIGYIVGARLKNLSDELKKEIISQNYQSQSVYETKYQDRQLIIDYSKDRAKKDQANRDRQIKKLLQRLQKKQTVIRKSKYLATIGNNQVTGIDQAKIKEDALYDGLKGYLTNTRGYLSAKQVIDHYHNLWKVEKAFRMSKCDLRERPVYHSKAERIKAHLLLCFVSLLVSTETEKILQTKGYSVERSIELLSQVGEGTVKVGQVRVELESESHPETTSILNLLMGH